MPYRTSSDPRSRLHLMVARVRVETPCRSAWDAMVGDDASRVCHVCTRMVHDLTAMDAADAEALLDGDGEACVRRLDGRVLAGECGPVTARRRAGRALAFLAAALAAALTFGSALERVVAEPVVAEPSLRETSEERLERLTVPSAAMRVEGRAVDEETCAEMAALAAGPAGAVSCRGAIGPTDPGFAAAMRAAHVVAEQRRDAVLTGHVQLVSPRPRHP